MTKCVTTGLFEVVEGKPKEPMIGMLNRQDAKVAKLIYIVDFQKKMLDDIGVLAVQVQLIRNSLSFYMISTR